MSKPTPGPWYVMKEPFRKSSFYIYGSGARGAVAHIPRSTVAPSEANARLIAAAPSLLEALDQLLERYTELVNCGDCGNWNPEEELEVIVARAAIAKATEAP